jgi:apolipoprotein N-acyltransferase
MPNSAPPRDWRALLIAFSLGVASVFAYAPFAWWPLLWVLLAGLFVLVERSPNPRAAALLGGGFGFGAFFAGVSWVYVSLSQFGAMPGPAAALATIAFCLYLAIFPALACAVYRSRPSRSALRKALFFAGCWGISEWLRGWMLSGFPWLAIGYSQTPGAGGSPLSGFAPLLGVFGVSTLTALLSVLLAETVRRYVSLAQSTPKASLAAWAKACTALPLVAMIGLLVAGQALREVRWSEPNGAPLKVALLQGNVEQDLKWDPQRFADSLTTYLDLASRHPAALTILPETALPTFFDRLPSAYLAAFTEPARQASGEILLGSVVGDGRRYTNSVVTLLASPQQSYSKTHLVPFGEFVPPGFDWFMRMLTIPMSDFSPGSPGQAPLRVAGQAVAMNICYEDLFGEEIINAAPDASILVNVSNTAWFGRSWAQPQHLQIARMRAAETARPMLRATNTGMTAAIGPDGTVLATLEPFTRGALVTEVQGMRGVTPYVRFGNGLALTLMVLFVLAAVRYRARSTDRVGKSR